MRWGFYGLAIGSLAAYLALLGGIKEISAGWKGFGGDRANNDDDAEKHCSLS
jgi:hypothetical protein